MTEKSKPHLVGGSDVIMDMALRESWYRRDDVLSNLVPLLREREVSFLVPHSVQAEKRYPVRCIKAHHHTYLWRNMDAFGFWNRPYNLYHSIFVLEGMPQFTFHPLKRSEQQQEFFRNYYNYVKGLDFVIDFDGDKNKPVTERIKDAQVNALRVCAVLERFDVPYNIVFSGSKGFHVEVRGFPATQEWSKRVSLYEQIATRLVLCANGEPYQPPTLQGSDLAKYLSACFSFDSSIYTTTRIWKVPYSYDVSTDCIAYPLTYRELESFHIEDYKAVNLIKRKHWGIGLKAKRAPISNFWVMAKALGVDIDEEVSNTLGRGKEGIPGRGVERPRDAPKPYAARNHQEPDDGAGDKGTMDKRVPGAASRTFKSAGGV